MQILLISKRLQ